MRHVGPASGKAYLEKAESFYVAAKQMNKAGADTGVSTDVVFYLLSHAIELAVKGRVFIATDIAQIRGHRLLPLMTKYREQLDLTDIDIALAFDLDQLNKGSGGLRYPNKYEGDFYPYLFNDGKNLIDRLLS